MTLETAVGTAITASEQLKQSKAAGSEANTRSLLIDPILSALGWQIQDIREVEREFRVFDGTFHHPAFDLMVSLGSSSKPRR